MPNPTEVLAATGDGLIAIVKRDCPTCELAGPVLATLQQAGRLDVYSQDDPSFPEQVSKVIDDRELSGLLQFGCGDRANSDPRAWRQGS